MLLRRTHHFVAVGVLASFVLAGCGGSPTSAESPSKSAPAANSRALQKAIHGLNGSKREAKLLEIAKKEGGLDVYSAFNDEQKMADAFTAKYDIPVKVYNANSETVLQRILQERRGGQVFNDVFIGPSADLAAAQDEGVLDTYASTYRDAVADKGKGERWTGVRRLAFVAGWNKDNVDSSAVPSDYSGFADPKWKGRISLELADFDWYATLVDYYESKGMSASKVADMFQKIAANAKIVKGHTAQGELLAAGQFGVALSLYTQTVERLKGSGAPVTFGATKDETVAPVVVRYDAGAVMSKARHPAAATLYLDFQLSQAGAKVDKELDSLPPIPESGDPLTGLTVIELDTARFVARRNKLSADYDALIKQGKKAS